ncbi:MAG: dihydrodipicolinate reductase [Acidimicrobiia bacterium]|nr:dihydrodipicolinate reductase [Acidimicrobiia bacterium]
MVTRVVQWSSGNVGTYALRAIAERSDLDLVGLFVTDPAKVGLDAGHIAHTDPMGVAATTDVHEIVALDADVVVHTPLPSLVHGDDPDEDVENFCRLLASGKHVITTVGYMYPKVHGAEIVGRLSAACTEGRSSFHGTGANPGWFGDLFPLLLSSLSLSIDRITVQEISNFQHYPSPEIMFDMMGFGRTVDDFAAQAARHRHWLDGLFTEAVQLVADGLGAEIDGVDSDTTQWLADRDYDTAAGTVRRGTVAGQRWRWAGTVAGQALIEQETVWRMHEDAAPDWPHGDWSITIAGNPAMTVSLPHGWNTNLLASTAAHALNAITYLSAAGPGIKTFLDLPFVAGRGAVRSPLV